MKKKKERTLVFAALAACMLILGACGKAEELPVNELPSSQEAEAQKNVTQENTIQETTAVVETDAEQVEKTENDESVTEEKDVSLNESTATDEEATDTADTVEAGLPEGLAQGDIPYGGYECVENGKRADINVEDGVADVIQFTGENWEGMYDIVWIEGNTYSIELGDKLGTAVIDANGNMQITAENEELKPCEGYYQITYVDDYLREMYNN